MVDVIPKNTDEEMLRYQEAERMLRARIPMKNNAALVYEADPITGRENAYSRLPSGGYVKIGDRAVTPVEAAKTDAMVAAPVATDINSFARDYEKNFGKNPVMEDYFAAEFTEAQTREYLAQREIERLSAPGTEVPVTLNQEQIQMGVDVGAPMIAPQPTTMRERRTDFLAGTGQSEASKFLSQVYEAIGLDSYESRRIAETVMGNPNATRDIGIGVADLTPAGLVFGVEEGYNTFLQGYNSGDPMTAGLGALEAGLSVLEAAPLMGAGIKALKKLITPTMRQAINTLKADAIGAGRAITRGDQDVLTEIFQPAGTPRSLGAAAVGDRRFVLAPPTQEPSVGGLAPQYRVVVENFSPEGKGTQSFIPQQMTPQNRNVSDEKLTILANEFPDPLSSAEEYAGMMARVRNTNEVPAPPTWMIEHANDTDKWASWFKNLTPNQIQAADEGLSVQKQFRDAYAAPDTGPELTGQLMFWSIMSRMLSAFPHESGFLELAQSADPYIKKALAGEWTEQTTSEWRNMVSSTIPLDSPGRSATSNANAFGETFLRKMSVKDDAGKSALERLHDMIADPNMSSAQIRRGYYGLASETGIGNKILSFALLVSGRNDVVVLDRIQINRMWGGGEKIYDDIMKQFEGAQGLAQYEALERSLASRIGEVYAKAGRETEGNVGRYHWESWVLSSGQVVSHPTLESVVRAGTPNVPRDIPPTAATPVMEGRFHMKYSGVKYEKLKDGGNRYTYSTSSGQPYQFTKAQLDDMFDQAFKPKSGVLPPNFPGVKAFEGGNIPWYEFEGVDRGKLDDLIRKAGKPIQ